jgi:hypothetical protein
MKLQAYIYTKKHQKEILFITVIEAIKDGKVLKSVKSKGIILEGDSLTEPLEIIIASLKKDNIKLSLATNDKNIIELAKLYEHFSERILINIPDDINFNDLIKHNEETNPDIPKYIYLKSKDIKNEFQKKLILFRIATYFDEKKENIFDFPLFLELKEDSEIVEEFVENIIEDINYVFKLL